MSKASHSDRTTTTPGIDSLTIGPQFSKHFRRFRPGQHSRAFGEKSRTYSKKSNGCVIMVMETAMPAPRKPRLRCYAVVSKVRSVSGWQLTNTISQFQNMFSGAQIRTTNMGPKKSACACVNRLTASNIP